MTLTRPVAVGESLVVGYGKVDGGAVGHVELPGLDEAEVKAREGRHFHLQARTHIVFSPWRCSESKREVGKCPTIKVHEDGIRWVVVARIDKQGESIAGICRPTQS